MGFMRTSATFLSRCFVYVCACVLLFLLLLLNSSVVFWGFTLNDWWQIAWYMKFPYLSFDSLCTTIFSSSSSFSFCYTWPISFRNYFFFSFECRQFLHISIPLVVLFKPGFCCCCFIFCKLSIVSSGFVLDLFLLFCNILWSCWLRLLFAILDYLLRSYFWVNFMFVFILLYSNVLNFSWNISDWMKKKWFEISNVRWKTCKIHWLYMPDVRLPEGLQWIVHTCISCTRQNSLNLHNKRTFFVTTISTKFRSNKNNVKIFGNKIWHKYGNLFYRFALIMHKNTAFIHKN